MAFFIGISSGIFGVGIFGVGVTNTVIPVPTPHHSREGGNPENLVMLYKQKVSVIPA